MKLFGNSKKKKKKSQNTEAGPVQESVDQAAEQTGGKARKVVKRLSLTVVVLALICVAVYAGVNIALAPPETKPATAARPSASATATATAQEDDIKVDGTGRVDGCYTFLVAGEDDDSGGTDVIMVGMLNVNDYTLNIISIPRDTMVNVPWETKKVNSYKNMYKELEEDYDAYIDALMAGVEKLIGFEVDSYITIDLDGFVAMIDAIGGVEYEVQTRMSYSDPAQNLNIDLEPGVQTLDGTNAMELVRYRGYEAGDIDRINVQQDFLKTAAQQLMDQNVFTMTELVSIFNEYAVTDMSWNNLLWYAKEMFKLDIENISFYTLDGNYTFTYGGLSYVAIYPDEWLKQINEYINPYTREITLDDLELLTVDSSGQLYCTQDQVGATADATGSVSPSASATASASSTTKNQTGG